MDRLNRLVLIEGRIIWRTFKLRSFGRDETVIICALLLFVLIRFYTYLKQIHIQLYQGDIVPARNILSCVLIAWVLAWMFSQAPNISKNLPGLPLKRLEHTALRLLAGLLSTTSLGLLVFSCTALSVILGNSVSDWVTNVCYLTFCIVVGCFGRRCFDIILQSRGITRCCFIFILASLAISIVLSTGSDWAPQHLFLIYTMYGSAWVISVFFALASVCLLGLTVVFPACSRSITTSSPKLFPFFLAFDKLPLIVPPLLLKDLRLMTLCLEPWILFAFSLQGMAYFCFEDNVHPFALQAFTLIVLFILGSISFNTFGQESKPSLACYGQLPISGQRLLVSKNIAFFIATYILMFPTLIPAVFRIGLFPPLTTFLSAAMMAILYATVGNYHSIKYPFRDLPYHFTTFQVKSGLLRTMALQIMCVLPGAAVVFLAKDNYLFACCASALGCILSGLIYWKRLNTQGKYLDDHLKLRFDRNSR
jgi:hypothetical protein